MKKNTKIIITAIILTVAVVLQSMNPFPAFAKNNMSVEDENVFETLEVGFEPGLLSAAGREDILSGINRELHDKLLTEIEKIASGEADYTVWNIPVDVSSYEGKDWTAADLGLDSLVESTDDGVQVSPQTREAVKRLTGYDGRKVILTLVNECMTQLYWFGLGYYCGYPYEVYHDGTEYKVRMTGTVHVIFSVSRDYAAKDPETGEQIRYTVDTSKISRVTEAIDRAKQIAEEAASISDDREKLKHFFVKIRELSGYDYAAASGAPYGDPWQIINVFDNDPETMVVCEGYSKAFQYLCDLSDFSDPELRAYCVTGYQTWEGVKELPVSTHMWNVVHMSDGNYLVDITNGYVGEASANTSSQESTAAQKSDGTSYSDGSKSVSLCLETCSKGSISRGYYIPVTTLAGKEVVYRYIYLDDTREIFHESALRISGNEDPRYCVTVENKAESEKTELTVTASLEETEYKNVLFSGFGSGMGIQNGTNEENLSDRNNDAAVWKQEADEGVLIEAALKNNSSGFLKFSMTDISGNVLDEKIVKPKETAFITKDRLDKDLHITIEETDIQLDEIKINAGEIIYSGRPQTINNNIEVYAKLNGESFLLDKNTDYLVKYSNNVNAGLAGITVTGIGNYKGTLTASFEIKPEQLSGTVEIGTPVMYYTGKKLAQKNVSVQCKGSALVKDKDYSISYKNNMKVGKASVIITGRGNYSGTLKRTFKIRPKGTKLKAVKAGKKSLTVKWKKETEETSGYQIQYSTKKNFKSGTKTITVKNNKKTSVKINKLKSNKTYCVRIRTYKKTGGKTYYSKWSALKKTRIK